MKKLITLVITGSLLLSACGGQSFEISGQTYEEFPPDEGSKRPIVRMNSVLDENLFFKVKYDPESWEIKETPGKYRTNLIFNNKHYKNETCVLLPGTKGYQLEKDYDVDQWSYRSDITWGIDYEFINPITGISEMRVFEAESNGAGFPNTLFELRLPTDGQDQAQCYTDWQQFIGTYVFESYEGTPEELQAILSELEATKAYNDELESKKELEELLEGIEEEEPQ